MLFNLADYSSLIIIHDCGSSTNAMGINTEVRSTIIISGNVIWIGMSTVIAYLVCKSPD